MRTGLVTVTQRWALAGSWGALALHLRAHTVRRRDIYATVLCEIAPLALLALTHVMWLGLILLFTSSLGGTLNWTFTTTYMQNHAPVEILGRVSAALITVNFAGMLLGAVVALVLAQLLGWPSLLLWFSVGCMVALSLVALQSRSEKS